MAVELETSTNATLLSPVATAAVVTILTILILDQWNWRRKKGNLVGPAFMTPLIGKLWDSIHPDFEKYKQMWASGEMTATSVFQHFIVIASTNELSRKIFNSPSSIIPEVLPSMRDILTHGNFVFLQGEAHVKYRKQLNPLFTRKALSIYLTALESEYKKNFTEWNQIEGHNAFYQRARKVTMDTSLLVFCGRYMDKEVAEQVSTAFYNITTALELVNFPFPLPGTKVYNAIQARKFIVKAVAQCAQTSIDRMARGESPDCLLDYWVLTTQKEVEKYKENPVGNEPVVFSCEEIALTVLTFLFASQDASTSSLVWMITLLADNPEIQEKVREEQKKLRPNNEELTLDVMDQMIYTKTVVKEVLRYRPPVIMVPHKAAKDVSISEGYTIPKGTIVIPSVWPSVQDPTVWENPLKFDPERFNAERQEDVKNPKNWLIFGHGPHACLGKEYALASLLAFVATGVTTSTWTRQRTAQSDDIKVMSTLYPMDLALINFVPV
eukprot:TRINITY_DN7964_c0_g1_i1.p1 TRINITY_DN7964_c0_g1~~TRINITY_DN7964_c0_g1_i1.p1  ORF type:complete len:496 (-),score=140.44 TRINITY_DN7964_c0_g1_i1:89-1576(-)